MLVPCEELFLLQMDCQGHVSCLLPSSARSGKVLILWYCLHLAVLPLRTCSMLQPGARSIQPLLWCTCLPASLLTMHISQQCTQDPRQMLGDSLPSPPPTRRCEHLTHQHPPGMLLGPDLDRFAQGHIWHQCNWPRQRCSGGRAQTATPGQPPLNVPPLIPAQDSPASVWTL